MFPGQRAKVLIGDDHALVAEAIRSLLAAEFDVIGIVGDGRALVQASEALKPDVVLIDIGMPKLNGLDAGQRIKHESPQTKIIYVTMNMDPLVVEEALAKGASAYLLKTVGRDELIGAVRAALGEGKQAAGDRHSASTAKVFHPNGSTLELTNRQRDVLQLLAEGLSMKQVAGVLNLATRTVAFHKYRLMEALGLTNDADIVQFAIRNHMLFVEGSSKMPLGENTPSAPKLRVLTPVTRRLSSAVDRKIKAA
jgi:DNA-binding NarL/FixJ family response regulator